MMSRLLCFCFSLGCVLSALAADEKIDVCHGYSCQVQDRVIFTEHRLRPILRALNSTVDPQDERKKLSRVIGRLYALAGEQSVIRNDRGGNVADEGVPGRMDCIDHTTTTERFLRLLQARGALRWHRVIEAQVRHHFLIFEHHAAAIEELNSAQEEAPRFVVDSWFVDHGLPAVILPLDEWMKGAGPNV